MFEKKMKIILIVLLILFITPQMFAQDIIVGDITLPKTKWGTMQASFELTNNSEYLKFIKVMIDIKYQGEYLNPTRLFEINVIVYPMDSKKVTPTFSVPPNFGRSELKFSLYDVVDTLDVLLDNQKFMEQPFILKPKTPEGIFPYLSEKITMPPMVNTSPDFDSEFSRILIFMISEGKTIAEISEIAEVDTEVILNLLKPMVAKGYASQIDGVYSLKFPAITPAEAEETKIYSEKISDSLANMIEKNMPLYWAELDKMVQAGKISADKNLFIDGGTILYNPYPVIGGLLLWHDLGRKFITRSAPLKIFNNTDFCKARIPYYMYAVQGGDVFNGTQFYSYNTFQGNYQILYGDNIPEINCEFYHYDRRQINWATGETFKTESNPEIFVLDTIVVMPVVYALDGGMDQMLRGVYDDLFKIADKYNHRKLLFGHRYWFWNLVSTQTMKKLTAKAVISPSGTGQFRFDGKK